jgi:glycolate oxidase FAD binding subunit
VNIDGFGPLPVARPASPAELGDLVRRAAADGSAVYPAGGGTMLHLGRVPTRTGTAIDTRGLDRVVDYPARDMTITLGAGVTLARLAETLASEQQRLPIDVPRPADATLGGAIAVNASGPRRLGLGTLRDYVIGMTVVTDEGTEAKAGGRVVKNVAGYDLPKLHIGALGTLGVVTQVTLKLKPRPERSEWLVFASSAAGMPDLLDRLHTTRSRPVAVEALDRRAAAEIGVPLPDGDFVLLAGFEEKDETVAWQLKQLTDELVGSDARNLGAVTGDAAQALWRGLTEYRLPAARPVTLKATMLPGTVAGFLAALAARPEELALHAHAGSGVVFAHAPASLTAEAAGGMLTALRSAAESRPGSLVVERCPPAWKATLPVWGPARPDLALMRAVKQKLDPRSLFNPGRFLDGL